MGVQRYPATLVGIKQKQQFFHILVCEGKLVSRSRGDIGAAIAAVAIARAISRFLRLTWVTGSFFSVVA